MATATKKRPKPPPVEEDEDEVEDIEELEEEDDEELDEAPAKKGKAVEEPVFGAAALAALLSKKVGREIKTKDLRALIRKMAREETPRVNREIIPGNKSRYSWSGPDDPEVKRIIKAVVGGEMEAQKKEALDKLKAKKATEAAKASKATKSTKKTKAPAVVEDDDEDEDFDLEDDED